MGLVKVGFLIQRNKKMMYKNTQQMFTSSQLQAIWTAYMAKCVLRLLDPIYELKSYKLVREWQGQKHKSLTYTVTVL